jgi:Tfp pilus assembly protein PilO
VRRSAFIVERMAAKDDLKNFATKIDLGEIVRAIIQEEVPGIVAIELKPVRNDLKQIEERLDALEQHYANLKGVTKGIDEIRQKGARDSKTPGHRKEDRGLITLVPAAVTLYNSRIS